MKRSTIKIALALGLLPACCFDEAGESLVSTASSSSDGSESSTDPSATATSSVTTTATTTSTNSDSDASSSEGTETSGESAASTMSEESSTGNVVPDWALAFDGTSYARKLGNGGAFGWSAQDFTVEVWLKIENESATGVIFDGTNDTFTSGWVLYLHNDWHAVVFSFFDDTHYNNVVVGPSVDAIGTGWHHVAATKSGDAVWIHVDGVSWDPVPVAETVAVDPTTLWSLGGNSQDDPNFYLRDAAVDDVRISEVARYTSDFDPPATYDADTEAVLLLLRIDEGEGSMTSDDEAGYIDFSVDSPAWTLGNT